jgi:hypothetical protein
LNWAAPGSGARGLSASHLRLLERQSRRHAIRLKANATPERNGYG